MTCGDVERMVEPYVDGELDLERALAFEAHVAGCEACAAHLDRARALSRTLKTAPYFRAPEALGERLLAANATAKQATSRTPPDAAPPRQRRVWPWLVPLASAAVVVLAVAGIMYQRAATADDATTQAVIEGHVRSLMAGHLTDVGSSDRHTVKPWFAGRIDFSPTVVDLATDGFPLVGGRLDYVSHHTAAALIYKRRDHVINVFIWPQTDGSPAHVTRSDPRGYHVISWTSGGMAIWVVSDLALDELDAFGRTLDAAMHR